MRFERPLKVEVAGSNPVGATRKHEARGINALAFFLTGSIGQDREAIADTLLWLGNVSITKVSSFVISIDSSAKGSYNGTSIIVAVVFAVVA